MSQDLVSDALNQIMNAKKSGKNSVELGRHSKFLVSILAISKLKGYLHDYHTKERMLHIGLGKLNMCKAIKPRYVVKADEIDKYVRRYLPARDMGTIIISTSKGLMTHQTAIEKNIGGSLVAYFY